jgi:hypothetical protein
MMRAAISPVLLKVMVAEYYRRNSGFFFLLILLLFGFFTAEHHRMLAELAVHDLRFFALAYGIPWLLYALKTTFWGIHAFEEQQNKFLLHHLSLLSPFRLYRLLMQVQLALLVPVLIFAFLLLRSAFNEQLIFAALLILFVIGILTVLPSIVWEYRLRRPRESKAFYSLSFFRIRYPALPEAWLLRKLLQEEPMLLFLSKALSLSFIAGVSALYYTDDYDERLILLGILAAGFSHLGIGDIAAQLERQMPVLRNLPMSFFRRMQLKAGSWLLVLLPDFLLIIRSCPAEIGILFTLAAPVFLFFLVMALDQMNGLLASSASIREKLIPAFFFFLGFAIMFSVPVLVHVLFLCLISSIIHQWYYFRAEA